MPKPPQTPKRPPLWRCPRCQRWVREPMGRGCAACRADAPRAPEEDTKENTDA